MPPKLTLPAFRPTTHASPFGRQLSCCLGRLLWLCVASYGLLYFCYKFSMPWGGTGDLQYYYPMYLRPLDLRVAPAPFCLRQVSAVLTHLVWKAHLYLPLRIELADAAYDQHVYFAALFTNWICLVCAALVAGFITERLLGRRDETAALVAGMLCLLSYLSTFAVISGIAEGPGWLLLALGALALLERRVLVLAGVLLLAIFERETVLLALSLLAFGGLYGADRRTRRFCLAAGAAAAACLLTYFALRLALPGAENQTHLGGVLANLRDIRPGWWIVTSGLLPENIAMLAVAGGWLARRRWPGALRLAALLLLVLLAIDLVGIAAGIGKNVGRVGGVLTPLFAALAAAALVSLELRESVHIPGN